MCDATVLIDVAHVPKSSHHTLDSGGRVSMRQVPNAAVARKSRGGMTGAPRRGRQRGGGERRFRDLGAGMSSFVRDISHCGGGVR